MLILHDVTLIETYMPKPPPLHMAGPVCYMDGTNTGGRLPPLFPEMAELSKSKGRLEGKCSISQAADSWPKPREQQQVLKFFGVHHQVWAVLFLSHPVTFLSLQWSRLHTEVTETSPEQALPVIHSQGCSP